MEQERRGLRTTVVIIASVLGLLLGVSFSSGLSEVAPIVFEDTSIIHNPREFTPSNPRIEFKKEWEICPAAQGGDSAEQILAMDIDTSGNVYVLGKSFGIRVYSKDGKYLRAIEGPGGGSDKFINPAAISLTESNSFIVGESMPSQLIFFDSRGKYIGESSLKDVKVIIRLQAMSAKRLLIEKADVKATIAGISIIRGLSIADSSGEHCTNIFLKETKRSLTSNTLSDIQWAYSCGAPIRWEISMLLKTRMSIESMSWILMESS
ncbi:MAG: 6-bladed beta-propeller [Candidatus Krumholzibacteriia bacterium]